MVQLSFPLSEIGEYCQRNGISRLALFGSALRNDFRPESDIDLLVHFRPDAVVGLFRITQMESDLSELIGRTVDLRTASDLSPYFRDEVMRSARVLYAEG